jgi:protein-tyrosine-phosphatase
MPKYRVLLFSKGRRMRLLGHPRSPSSPSTRLGIASKLMIVLALAGPLSGSVANAQRAPTRVLFVCQYGTVKSALARELFRRRAEERGIKAVAFSRGITPAEHLAAAARASMAADGIDPARDPLRKLARADLRKADIVVVFNPLPLKLATRPIRDWAATPSVNDDYASARPELDRRIDALLDEIATPGR